MIRNQPCFSAQYKHAFIKLTRLSLSRINCYKADQISLLFEWAIVMANTRQIKLSASIAYGVARIIIQ